MSTPTSQEPSVWRAWFALIGLSVRRQSRAAVMMWVALGLLLIVVAMIAGTTRFGGWTSGDKRVIYSAKTGQLRRRDYIEQRLPPISIDEIRRTTVRHIVELNSWRAAATVDGTTSAIEWAAAGTIETALQATAIGNFTRTIMFPLFLGFLLPIWCLSFATEAIGGDREGRSLVWLLTRPIPRWAIYVGKYVAVLPWTLGFCVGGFGLMCLAAGSTGRLAFSLYWPAIAGGAMAFTSLFHFFAAATRRPTVIGLVYCIFLEAFLGDMPGLLKRCSVSFYIRCLIFDTSSGYGVTLDKPSVYLPVSASVAWLTLAGLTVGFLILGAMIFSRAEYRDDGT